MTHEQVQAQFETRFGTHAEYDKYQYIGGSETVYWTVYLTSGSLTVIHAALSDTVIVIAYISDMPIVEIDPWA